MVSPSRVRELYEKIKNGLTDSEKQHALVIINLLMVELELEEQAKVDDEYFNRVRK